VVRGKPLNMSACCPRHAMHSAQQRRSAGSYANGAAKGTRTVATIGSAIWLLLVRVAPCNANTCVTTQCTGNIALSTSLVNGTAQASAKHSIRLPLAHPHRLRGHT